MSDYPPQQDEDDQQRLRRQYHELAQLAGELAHEIKNPLSVIGLNMDLLAEDFAAPKNAREQRTLRIIKTVSNQCMRLEHMLDDFLRFARLDKLQLRPGSLNAQVERVLDLYAPKANEQNVDFVTYLDPDLPSVRLDNETIQAALVNLVKNALEAMPDGGQLTARTYVTRTHVALDLIDTGVGMDGDTVLHMFDPFYSTKHGGSGLGLPMARKVIEAHGAFIDVQSDLGRGTKFTLMFPMPARLR